MAAFEQEFIIPAALMALVAGIFIAVIAGRIARARRRAARRVVEKPNSHYSSALVREQETRHHWHEMALDRMHEINREEVVRLLAKVDAAGVAALRPDERRFLDYMAELVGTRSTVDAAGKGRHRPATLRHRTV